MSLFGQSKLGPTIGIDIGSKLIKVVEAKPGKDGVQVTAIGIGPTPPGTIDNEIIVDPQALGQSIRHLLSESGISTKRCVSSIAGQSSVVVRIIEVPKMTRQELTETMKWEVERHVPFAADEIMMDFQPVEREDASPDDQNMEVLLAVAQQEVINSHIETLFAAGLEPFAIDVEPLAISRALIDSSQNGLKQGTIAICSIGASVTDMGIYRDGILVFPRTLPLAGDSVTRAISEALGISEEQAERLKREQGSVIMDRINRAPQDYTGMPVAQPNAAPVQQNTTIDVSAAAPQAPTQADAAFGFIPGLGFLDSDPAAQQAPSAEEQPGVPDFDMDFGGSAPKPPKPALDFDLAGEQEDGNLPELHRPGALDLSDFDSSEGGTDFLGNPIAAPETPAAPIAADSPLDAEDPVLAAPPAAFDVASLSSLKQDSADVQASPESLFDAMLPALGDIVTEIRRSIEYYTTRFQGTPDKILLCGGTAKLPDLDKLIEAELGIPVILANPLQNLTVFSRSLSDDYLTEVATVLPVSVGLAIREMIGD